MVIRVDVLIVVLQLETTLMRVKFRLENQNKDVVTPTFTTTLVNLTNHILTADL